VERAPLRLVGALAAALALTIAAPDASAYTAKRAHYRKKPSFAVTYTGAGSWATTYHSEPPNEGGNPDTNDAHDSSAQSWRLTFQHALRIPPCGRPKGGGRDRCDVLAGLSGATGPTAASGHIDHRHVDGLYSSQDASVKCDVRASTPARGQVDAEIGITYSSKSRHVAIMAFNPVSNALLLLPSSCPSQGDSIDGLYDNYFTPGFSFSSAYGPDRWFTSRQIVIPARVFHHSTRITVGLAATPAGTPPADCAVQHPSYEQCMTGGSWDGVLTFRLLQ
jgi:hypothetical protein